MLAFFAGFGGGVLMLSASRRRLEYLKTLPEDSSANPAPPKQPGADDLVDLKLS